MGERAPTEREEKARRRRIQLAVAAGLPALLALLEEARARLRDRVAGVGTMDQTVARQLIREVEVEISLLVARMRVEMGGQFVAVMEQADQDAIDDARELLAAPPLSAAGLDPTLVAFAADNASDWTSQITGDLQARLNRVIRAGAASAATPAEVAAEIGAIVRKAARPTGVFGSVQAQTERIFRTETSRLYSGAAQDRMERVARETGREVRKRWSARVDGRVRDTHADMNGATIAMHEHFNVGAGPKWSQVSWEEATRQGGDVGWKAKGPLDSFNLPVEEVANCRCMPVSVFVDVPTEAAA